MKKALRIISLVMLVIAVAFVAIALSAPTLGSTKRWGNFVFSAAQWRMCYGAYLVVMSALFAASFFTKRCQWAMRLLIAAAVVFVLCTGYRVVGTGYQPKVETNGLTLYLQSPESLTVMHRGFCMGDRFSMPFFARKIVILESSELEMTYKVEYFPFGSSTRHLVGYYE